MEHRRRVRGGGRNGARVARAHPGRPRPVLAGTGPPGRAGRGVPGRPGAGPPGQGRAVPAQLPGVPGVVRGRAQRLPGAGEHQLPLRPRGTQLPVAGLRRPRGGVRRVLHGDDRAHPRVGPGRAGLAVGGRRFRALPAVGRGVRVGRGARRPPPGAALGAGRRRHHPAVHRGHHRAAQGRDLAAGRPDGVAGQRGGWPVPRPAGPGVRPVPDRRPRAAAPPGRAAHARRGLPDLPARAGPRRRRRPAGRAGLPRRGTAGHHRTAPGELGRLGGRRVRPAGPGRAGRPSRSVGPEFLVGAHLRRGAVLR